MKSNKVMVHASLALCAAVALLFVFAGCEKREENKPVGGETKPLPEVYPAEGHGYMDDPAFKAQLAAQDARRASILGEREKICQAMDELAKKSGSLAAAEKTSEWAALEQRLQVCMQTFETNRLETTELLRVRMKQAQADSERIKRGEATAKKPTEASAQKAAATAAQKAAATAAQKISK